MFSTLDQRNFGGSRSTNETGRNKKCQKEQKEMVENGGKKQQQKNKQQQKPPQTSTNKGQGQTQQPPKVQKVSGPFAGPFGGQKTGGNAATNAKNGEQQQGKNTGVKPSEKAAVENKKMNDVKNAVFI